MNTHKMKLALALFACTVLTPAFAFAYESTEQTATLVGPNTIMYTVAYKFGFLNREMQMPILAQHADTDSTALAAEYEFMTGTTPVKAGVSNAIVLTDDEDVEIKDGKYYLPAGRNAEFTLVSFLTLPTTDAALRDNTVLQMTNLPYLMIDGAEVGQTAVKPEELAAYRTPTIVQKVDPVTISVEVHSIISTVK